MIRRLALAALAALALWPAAASAQVITSTPPSCAKAGANTVTASAPVLDCTQTWNNAGITFYGFRLNVTDTASATPSYLMDLQVAGASKFSVSKDGTITSPLSFVSGGNVRVLNNAGYFALGSTSDVFLNRDAANTLALRNGASAQTFRVYNTYTDASNGEWGVADWNTSANIFYVGTRQNGTGVARDLGLMSGGNSRWLVKAGGDFYAALDNTYDIGASGANRPRNIFAATQVQSGQAIKTGTTTVASLTSCATIGAGARWMVTDATVAASGNFGATLTGGGANTVPVYCDGTSWKIG